MKSTQPFKDIISAHLDGLAAADPLFAETLKKPNKTIDGCVNYILNRVQKSGCNGFADAEIFGMANHYYDEDDVTEGKPVNCKVVVNHSVELSTDDIEKAKEIAFEKIVEDQKNRIKKKSDHKKEQTPSVQHSLF